MLASELEHRNPVTPWDGARLAGVVTSTWVHGVLTRDRTGDGVLAGAAR